MGLHSPAESRPAFTAVLRRVAERRELLWPAGYVLSSDPSKSKTSSPGYLRI